MSTHGPQSLRYQARQREPIAMRSDVVIGDGSLCATRLDRPTRDEFSVSWRRRKPR